MENNLVQNLHRMQNDLKAHNRSRDALLTLYIKKRLTKSVESYYADLMRAQSAVEQRDARKVFKEILKEEKNAQHN